MVILSNKFKTLIIFSSIALLTACNQPTKTGQPTKPFTTTTQTSAATADPHAGHNMNNMAMGSSTATTQPAYVTEYMQSMTAMHDKMMSATQITNADVAFATGMIAHHQGAIDMAKIQLKYGKDSQMRTLAENIIKAQQGEIQVMQTWLAKHQNDKNPANATMLKMDMKNNDTMVQGIMVNDPDVAFAKGMIPHHQGAITMADTELKMGKDKAMLDLAKRIKTAQDPEIKQMQAWLESKGVK